MKASVQDGKPGGSNPEEGQNRTEPEALECRQLEPAGQLSEVPERVGALVSGVGRVRERPDAAAVHHDDRRATHLECIPPAR